MQRRTLLGARRSISVAVALFAPMPGALAIAAVHAVDQPPPNTGMADPVALVQAFDRFAAGDGDVNVVTLPLGNLRGLSDEARNAGGRVRSISLPEP